jgi:hypothetical protein
VGEWLFATLWLDYQGTLGAGAFGGSVRETSLSTAKAIPS